MLQEIIRARPNLRILILDAHNEYGRPFGDKAFVLNPGNLKLPFWLYLFQAFPWLSCKTINIAANGIN
jgi:hypothetical protein